MMWLLTLMTSLSILMMFLSHPLSMGMLLILQTIIVALTTGMIAGMFLMSYIITIIMLSGALVLFIYMASVASNEKFYTPVKLMIMFMLINMIVPLMLNKYEDKENMMINLYPMMEALSTMKLFSEPSAYITIMMIMYLLFTMIVVSNNVNINEGPLRMKIYE